MVQIIEITNNPFWEHDIDKAIDNFEAAYGVEPHMIIGRNFIELITASYNWIYKKPSEDITVTYKGVLCKYDPDISCVILEA